MYDMYDIYSHLYIIRRAFFVYMSRYNSPYILHRFVAEVYFILLKPTLNLHRTYM